jgi:4-hydroxy-3-polyprenylbenzoate decarboxylase
MGRLLGVHQSTVHRWEQEGYVPRRHYTKVRETVAATGKAWNDAWFTTVPPAASDETRSRSDARDVQIARQDWRKRLIVGITGASGTIYGLRLLQACRDLGLETHLCLSRAAELTMAYELELKPAELKALAHKSYPPADIGAAIASGSFRTRGMVIAPCSIRTMAEIATGTTSSALTRAADVVLKEQRKLILMLRETPLHAGHLENLLRLARMGAIIAPPVPAFYIKPKTVDALVDHAVGRVLDLLEIDNDLPHRWREGET